eukprot:Skav234809  [mRNA]  locus=scaffold69:674188:678065:- [translate_table: standard]
MGRRGRRDKKAQKEWLSEKRRGADVEAEDRGPLKAEEDFRSYYDSQEFFGAADQAAFWAALRSPLPVTLRVRDVSVESSLTKFGWKRRSEFDAAGMSVWEINSLQYDGRLRHWAERENRRGSICFQELVSLVPALLLAPMPGDVCLDLCAAPGNKSLQLIEALTGRGHGGVLSADNDPQRCCLTLHRVLGKAASPASCAALAHAGHFPVLVDQSSEKRIEFSKILADVPCSGDGTARKNSQVWRSWSRRDALNLQRLQRQILLRGLYLLPPDGVLVYSTCSLNPVENEAVVLSTLKKWHSAREGRSDYVTLLDAVAIIKEKCGLQPAPGLTKWRVPSPQRGGPLFESFAEVPDELRNDERLPLRPEMFSDDALAQDMVRCARFFPQSCDTGAFFVCILQKSAAPAVGPSQSQPDKQIEGRGAHPLLSTRFHPISANDAAWNELTAFFKLDTAWCEDKMKRGLLFWQTMKGKSEPERVTLVSEAVAKLWAAKPCDGRKVAWARLGVFLFEQLPKGLLNGVAPCRWRLHAEGVMILAPVLQSRRVVLPPVLMQQVLQCEHRQTTLTEGTPLANAVAHGAGGSETKHHHVCGGIMVGIGDLWFPGVVTPKQLRILVDEDSAESLMEQLIGLPPPLQPTMAVSRLWSCWEPIAKICFGRYLHEDFRELFWGEGIWGPLHSLHQRTKHATAALGIPDLELVRASPDTHKGGYADGAELSVRPSVTLPGVQQGSAICAIGCAQPWWSATPQGPMGWALAHGVYLFPAHADESMGYLQLSVPHKIEP